ncbi:hypothetical protein EV368DRAFT_86363 [Lentinula lateritia]|uniref:Uncharacterized protein n=1 Tax=Lentinula aff. lateritia TaxID=2804960 RepID=A0ACC1TNA9_9AGAR|nr:hypothetical protein F5876DRAFT_81053 [Lentinula aff. lateritia]KAJ3848673.1 hypothetical protein EV368DRAFT_86363 [Lentinula lateritia]
MCTKTLTIAKKTRSPTPDRSSRSQLFGSPPPRPSRTYGRNNQNRSRNGTPSHRNMPSSRLRSPPAASSSTASRHIVYDLTLDYDEPILLPASPSCSPSPSQSTPNLGGLTNPKSLTTRKDNGTTPVEYEDNDDEPIFVSMKSAARKPAVEVELGDHEALRRAHNELEISLQNVRDNIEALKEAAKACNNCPCCLEVMFQPFILLCGHTFCKDCLLRLADVYLKAKMNFACPDCRTLQGRFTPIPNYASQHSVDQMLESQGIQPPPLQWPLRFQSSPVSFPFPRRNGTYPVLAPRFAPAPFPIANDE